jgi:hypothetical protein
MARDQYNLALVQRLDVRRDHETAVTNPKQIALVGSLAGSIRGRRATAFRRDLSSSPDQKTPTALRTRTIVVSATSRAISAELFTIASSTA